MDEKGGEGINVEEENKRQEILKGTCLSVFPLHCSCCLALMVTHSVCTVRAMPRYGAFAYK